METLDNEKKLLAAENTKLRKMNEMQEAALKETKKSLKAAQNDILLLHGSTSGKIEDLRQIIKFSFEEIIDLQHHGENEEVIERLQEIEDALLTSLKDNTSLVQKFAKAQAQLDVTRNLFEDYEGHKPNRNSYKTNQSKSRGGNEVSSEDYYEMKERVASLEKVLEEKERTYKELQTKYQQIENRWAEKHEDSKKHIRVIEENLEIMMDKLEQEFSNKQEIMNFIDTNINKTDENTPTYGTEAYESNDDEEAVKKWLEKENRILREGLLAALEKMKEVNRESQELKEILEGSLEDFENALAQFEKRRGSVRANGDKANLEGTLRNVIYSIKDSLKAGGATEEQGNKRYSKAGLADDLMIDNKELKEKVNLLLNHQKNHEEVVSSYRQNLDSAIRDREEAKREKESMTARFEQLKQDWMNDRGTIEKYVEEVLRAINEVKRIEIKAEKQHEDTEKKLKEFWKQLETLQKNEYNRYANNGGVQKN